MSTAIGTDTTKGNLQRQFGLVPSMALNMSNMIGIGPFITIPALMTTVNGGGPQALMGWLVALVIAIPDGMVWAELGSRMPGSGGSYVYLREGYGREKWGRLMAFLFIWQFILSGPLEIASAYIGFAQYIAYVFPNLPRWASQTMVVGLGSFTVFLLYRRIQQVAVITVTLWIGVLITVGWVLVTGARSFNPALAFDFPPGAIQFNLGFLAGMGAATRIGIYDYLGYYSICFVGDEVRDPRRVIPRSILLSLGLVALIYIGINLSVLGTVPWRSFVPATDPPAPVASLLMEHHYGRWVAVAFTVLVLWTALGSVFALLLGYSRIPYAAARDGGFFKIFGRLHPTGHFPHLSLLILGGMSIACSFLSLGTVIDALIIMRVAIQFLGQIGALALLRKTQPENRPISGLLYPWTSILAAIGWCFILATTELKLLSYSGIALFTGIGAFLIWAKIQRQWPFPNPETRRNPISS